MVRRRGYRLYNINNLKLARFKEIFPGAAQERSDRCAQGIGAVSAERSSAVSLDSYPNRSELIAATLDNENIGDLFDVL